jgi:hypothetical protein
MYLRLILHNNNMGSNSSHFPSTIGMKHSPWKSRPMVSCELPPTSYGSHNRKQEEIDRDVDEITAELRLEEDYRLTHCGDFLAFTLPTFLRSTFLGSRVMNPWRFIGGL